MPRFLSVLSGLAVAFLLIAGITGLSSVGSAPARATPSLGIQCQFNSDCVAYLSCKGAGYCMAQCHEDRDCGPGNRCAPHLWNGERDLGRVPVGSNTVVPSNIETHNVCVTNTDTTPVANLAALSSGITVSPAVGPGDDNMDRPGADYRSLNLSTAAQCADACQADGTCKSWTFVKAGVQAPNAICDLKSAVPAAVPNTCCTSGVALQ